MLRTKSALPQSAARWMAQVSASVAASLAATLAVSLIYAALPRPAIPEAAPPELTSGGKFATRAIVHAAFDGLDTMPLPQVVPRAVQAAEVPPMIRRVAFDAAAPLLLAPERPARAARAPHGPAKAEARRGGGSDPAPQAVITAATPRDAGREAAASEGGFLQAMLPAAWPAVLPKVVSTARAAWTVTASAGESLVDRVVSRIP